MSLFNMFQGALAGYGRREGRAVFNRILVLAALGVMVHGLTWGQTVSGVRGISGGVGALFNLVGFSGNLYVDNNGNQGYIYTFGTFETYNFRSAGGPAWSGGQMTLGPQLSVGLIQGVNQGPGPIVFPSQPRQTPAVPEIESTLLTDIP